MGRLGVDVFIPCYNYGRYLKAAVECALGQDGPPVRVLIIDDASSDETPKVGAELAARYPNVAFTRHARNAGHISTYNEGLAWAEQKYFQFLSADDLLPPGALARGVAFFEAHPDVGLVYGRTRTFSGEVPHPERRDAYEQRVIDGLEFVRTAAEHGGNPIANPAAVLVRTDLQQKIGGYLHELPHSGDMEMWLRFAVHAPVGYLDVEQGWYRRHTNNMSLGYLDLADYEQKLDAFEELCRRYRDRIPDHAAIMRTVRRTIAAAVMNTSERAYELGLPVDVDAHVRFALKVDPAIVQTRVWRRFKVKRTIGRRLSRQLSALKSFVARA